MKVIRKMAVCLFAVVLLAACNGTEGNDKTNLIDTDRIEFGLMLAMPEEKFHEFRGKLDTLMAAGEIDIPLMRIFVNNHTLVSYEILYLEYRSGRMFSPDEITKRIPAFPYLGYIYVLKPISPRIEQEMLRLYSYIGITIEDIVEVGLMLGMYDIMNNVMVVPQTEI